MATAKKVSEEKTKPKKAAAKPADKVKKAVAAKPKATAATKKTSSASSSTKAKKIGDAERYRMIEVAAYYIAEKHHFSGNTADYWIQAEQEINAKYPK
ncbi:DUF2934 domain-containing protein [Methylotenera sp. N17]|uniref:DUF2934 domain-containing protein n=1 Tax=Methylotenera sp. N17 TaxID=1502761 RepID=UPI000646D211|nr:DUF2934 domain-containing protein [Methylotenera sp. N17]